MTRNRRSDHLLTLFIDIFPQFAEINFVGKQLDNSFVLQFINPLKLTTMKKLFAFLLLSAIGLVSFAQSAESNEKKGKSDEMNTLFNKGEKVKVGWFIGIDPGYTKFDSKDVWLAGLSVGAIINHNFTIGLTGRSWIKSEQLYYNNVSDTTGAYLEGGYGGLLLEYTLFPKALVHVTFPVMIGAGGASYVTKEEYYTDDNNNNWDKHHRKLDSQAFFVIEPGVRAEMNVFKFMRLNAGISYRYAPNFHLMNTSSDLMNSFTGTIGLKFGKF